MLIHHFNRQTGQYYGSNDATEDPQHKGRWLIPAFATDTPLPEGPPSGAYIWCNGEWIIDFTIIKQQKHAAAMTEFEVRMKKAIAENIGKADAMAAGLLEGVDKALFKAWAAYQVALRGVINAPNFPEEIHWPTEPDEHAIAQEFATAK